MAGHGGHAVIFRFTSDFPNLKKCPAQKLKNRAVPHKRELASCIHRLQSCAALVASQRWLEFNLSGLTNGTNTSLLTVAGVMAGESGSVAMGGRVGSLPHCTPVVLKVVGC